MERIINYVYNSGLGIFAVGFTLDLIIKSTGQLAEFKTSAEYLWKCGALLILIQIFYRFIHWKKYERENFAERFDNRFGARRITLWRQKSD